MLAFTLPRLRTGIFFIRVISILSKVVFFSLLFVLFLLLHPEDGRIRNKTNERKRDVQRMNDESVRRILSIFQTKNVKCWRFSLNFDIVGIHLLCQNFAYFLLLCILEGNIVSVFTLIWHFRVPVLELDSVPVEKSRNMGRCRLIRKPYFLPLGTGLKVLLEVFRRYDCTICVSACVRCAP